MNTETVSAESYCSCEVQGNIGVLFIHYVTSFTRDYGAGLMIYSAKGMWI
jgi:hypothetical protein